MMTTIGGHRGWSHCWKRASLFNASCMLTLTRANATCIAWTVWMALSALSASLTTRITVQSRFVTSHHSLVFAQKLCIWHIFFGSGLTQSLFIKITPFPFLGLLRFFSFFSLIFFFFATTHTFPLISFPALIWSLNSLINWFLFLISVSNCPSSNRFLHLPTPRMVWK